MFGEKGMVLGWGGMIVVVNENNKQKKEFIHQH